jgi:hypothetical protein
MDDGRVVGLRAFRCVSAVPRDQWDGCSVRSCMIPAEEVPTLHPEAAATDAVVELSQSTAAAELMPARRPWSSWVDRRSFGATASAEDRPGRCPKTLRRHSCGCVIEAWAGRRGDMGTGPYGRRCEPVQGSHQTPLN